MDEAYFDGLCDPNPGGVATYGFLVKRGGKKIHEGHGLACPPKTPQATNNVAEYMGVIQALDWLVKQKPKGPVIVRGDSDLVIRQLKGEWKVKSSLLAPLHRRAADLAAEIPDLTFEWIPRERNSEADRLTNIAYAEFTGKAMRAPTTDVMTIDLIVAAPSGTVMDALRKAGIKALTTPLPGGVVRVQVDLPAQAGAIDPLLALKRRLEGSL